MSLPTRVATCPLKHGMFCIDDINITTVIKELIPYVFMWRVTILIPTLTVP